MEIIEQAFTFFIYLIILICVLIVFYITFRLAAVAWHKTKAEYEEGSRRLRRPPIYDPYETNHEPKE